MMKQLAKLYIYGVVAAGALALGAALMQLRIENPALLALLTVLATIGGALKMRVPGLDGNLSLSFVPMILGSVVLSMPEAILVAALATFVQATAFVKKRNALKISFNCAALSLSMAVGAWAGSLTGLALLRLVIAGGVFYVANSVFITTVIGLVAEKPVLEIWDECLRSYLPFFVSGLACALMVLTGSTEDERRALQYPGVAVMPLMLLSRQYFKSARFVQQ
jgi:hypothetical protein